MGEEEGKCTQVSWIGVLWDERVTAPSSWVPILVCLGFQLKPRNQQEKKEAGE